VIRVLIADDHGVLRDGLGRLVSAQPDMLSVGTAANGVEAVARCRETTPDVVLMDIEMPVMNGIEATAAILAELPDTKVIALTSFSDRHRIVQALEAGAIGYLVKDVPAEEVVRGVRAAVDGSSAMDPRVERMLRDTSSRADPLDRLSPREREVLGLLLEGMPNKLIAGRLGISEKTVKSHLTSIFRQIGVTDRVQAVLWAGRRGLRADVPRRHSPGGP
jgi:DNA-binding NarL/FixJ family response regulator